MIRAVLTVPKDKEILKKNCDEVHHFDQGLYQLIQDMHETMQSQFGAGLAAPQIGICIRLFVLRGLTGGVINPRILWRSAEKETVNEGCLSIPGLTVPIERATAIEADWVELRQDLTTKLVRVKFNGIMARAFQHEYDHLFGKLFTQYIKDRNLRFRIESGRYSAT